MSTVHPGHESSSVVIRLSHEDDAPALRRLAELDSAPAPRGQMLLAEVDGTLRAAYSKHDGTVLADPFHATRQLVALLEAHADGESAGPQSSGWRITGLRVAATSSRRRTGVV